MNKTCEINKKTSIELLNIAAFNLRASDIMKYFIFLIPSALGHHHHHTPIDTPIIVKMEDIVEGAKFEHPDLNQHPEDQEGVQGGVVQDGPGQAVNPGEADHPVGAVEIQPPNVEAPNVDKEAESMEEEGGEGGYSTDQLQFLMGLSLVVGFVFMLLVDQCGGGHSHSHVSGEKWAEWGGVSEKGWGGGKR